MFQSRNLGREAEPTLKGMRKQLYDNLSLLFLEQSPSKDLASYFNKEMFDKPNSVICPYILHYLIGIIQPSALSSLSPRQLLDKKIERQFYTECLKLISSFNDSCDGPMIPKITLSHLLVSNNVKSVLFLVKLSQLAIYQTLSKDNTILLPMPASTNTAIAQKQVEIMEKVNCKLLNEVHVEMDGFRENLEEIKEFKQKMVEELSKNEAKVSELEAQLQSLGIDHDDVKLKSEKYSKALDANQEHPLFSKDLARVLLDCGNAVEALDKLNTTSSINLDLEDQISALSNTLQNLQQYSSHLSDLVLGLGKLLPVNS